VSRNLRDPIQGTDNIDVKTFLQALTLSTKDFFFKARKGRMLFFGGGKPKRGDVLGTDSIFVKYSIAGQ